MGSEDVPPPEFDIGWRGYDRHQVDTFLHSLERDPLVAGNSPAFDIVFRGYSRKQVRDFLEARGCPPPIR